MCNIRGCMWNIPSDYAIGIGDLDRTARVWMLSGGIPLRALVNMPACFRNEIRSESRLSPPFSLRSARFTHAYRPETRTVVRTIIIVQLSSIDTVNPNSRRAFPLRKQHYTGRGSPARSSSSFGPTKQKRTAIITCTHAHVMNATHVLLG